MSVDGQKFPLTAYDIRRNVVSARQGLRGIKYTIFSVGSPLTAVLPATMANSAANRHIGRKTPNSLLHPKKKLESRVAS